MTTNNIIMDKSKDCKQLDPQRKLKIRIDHKGRIMFINNYFTEFTGYKVHELILKDFSILFDNDTPKMTLDKLLEIIDLTPTAYFIYKGKTSTGDCYWGILRSTQRISNNEIDGYNLDVKMLPPVSVSKIERLFDIIREIENNAGLEAANKYFEGYLEEKGLSFNDFIFDVTEINDKKAEQYFSIDIDDVKKTKKKGWF